MRKKTESARFIKNCIAESIIKLSENKDYDDITVKEICETAGVGRTTYYRYFSNKNGKNQCLVEYTFSKWADYCVGKEKQISEDKARVLYNFIYEHKEYFLWLSKNGLTNVIFDVFYLSFGPNQEEESHIAAIKSFTAGGIYGIVYNWIQNGFKETPNEIINKFSLLKEEDLL
ncbi:MAG: TetR/AcrR family transcriptional regulator [bacterium]|nr:TetR/AcrR family transcriptional regulator [bacterium]